ncbi:uncharacterized protein LOC141595996 [Silene latifolia]|uniref:uncharacterized protein LOC141595996 n=1 Tax=Silene latifolia TaxID=37657 RepID=UPI003D76CB54
MGQQKKMEAPSSSSLRWTDRMDKVFIDALMNEVVLGNRVDGSFTSHAYDNIVKECSEKMNQPLTKAHLKNRLKTIKKNFNDVFDLFGASGWGWNEVTAMFDNEDEVWESLLEKKPEAKKWKNTPFPHFDLLAKLFSKDRATGAESATAKEKSVHMTATIIDSNDWGTMEGKTGDSKDSADSKKGKKRKATEDVLREEISIIKQGLDNVAQALREGNEVIEKGRPRVYTSQEVFEELSRMELDQITRRKAYRFLSAKQTRVRELFGSPPEERKEYLIEMMIDDE